MAAAGGWLRWLAGAAAGPGAAAAGAVRVPELARGSGSGPRSAKRAVRRVENKRSRKALVSIACSSLWAMGKPSLKPHSGPRARARPRSAAPKAKMNSRGPARKPQSKVKTTCAYAACRNHDIDCKNKPFILSAGKVNRELCRSFRSDCKQVRFCGLRHLQLCKQQQTEKKKTSASAPRGQEALTVDETRIFLHTLLHKVNCPWAVVVALLQIFAGERISCVLQARASWFQNLSSDLLPVLEIPEDVNGKTKTRKIPLDVKFAQKLWGWISQSPLTSCNSSVWPHPEQDLAAAIQNRKDDFLFPGRMMGGPDRRNLDAAVTARAYDYMLKAVAKVLKAERNIAHENGLVHEFSEVDLARIGSHSFKKTAITLLIDEGVPLPVISQHTATTQKVIQKHYDIGTNARQRRAVACALSRPLLAETRAPSENQGHCEERGLVRCSTCDISTSRGFLYCPLCGSVMDAVAPECKSDTHVSL